MIDIPIPALPPNIKGLILSAQNNFNLIAASQRSLCALRRYMKRIPIPNLNWKLIHITPVDPPRVLEGNITCRQLLEMHIPGGRTEKDNDWLDLLGDEINQPSTKHIAIHCEAALMALAHNPSGDTAKAAGLEEVVVRFNL